MVFVYASQIRNLSLLGFCPGVEHISQVFE
jgi:hypothetical protein